MKTYAVLALLSLTLAACSQQAIISPDATTAKASSRGEGVVVYRTTDEAQEAQVLTELNHVGMGTQLSAQAVAGQVYLNVLPVPSTAGAVRAYVKSTFTSPATCTVDWGDVTPATSVASPTVGRIETKDHLYAAFGTYTVKVTCMDGTTVLGQQSVTIQGGLPVTDVTLDFEAPVVTGSDLILQSYAQNGFVVTTRLNNSDGLYLSAPYSRYNPSPTQVIDTNYYNDSVIISAVNGLPFALKSFDFAPEENLANAFFTITGTRQDGTILSAVAYNNSTALITVPFINWTNLTSVEIQDSHRNIINLDNVKLSR